MTWAACPEKVLTTEAFYEGYVNWVGKVYVQESGPYRGHYLSTDSALD